MKKFNIAPALLSLLLMVAAAAQGQTLVGWGANEKEQSTVPSGTFTAAAAGAYHNVAIRTNGTLVAWGDNSAGQSTVPDGAFMAVSAGQYFSVAIRTDGTLVAWGDNAKHQTEVPTGTFQAVAAGSDFGLGLRTDGTLAAWGDNTRGQTVVPTGTFTAISAGRSCGYAIRTDGTLAAWGENDEGETNVPTGTFVAVSAGTSHGIAMRADGTLAGWGSTYYGESIVPSGTYKAISGGGYVGFAIKPDNTLVAWGYNGYGETNVPAGEFSTISGGTFYNAVAITAVPPKRLIYFGSSPSTTYVRANIREMENIPFDGIAITDGQNWRSWSRRRLDWTTDFKSTADNLAATDFRLFTDNFLTLYSYFYTESDVADWFDPAWSAIPYNAALVARAAKMGGCKGIFFDPEQYGDVKMWDYDEAKSSIPFTRYRDKVRERGWEFIRAINKEFPDITILVPWGYELPVIWDGPYGKRAYILLAAFLDGMCEAATPQTKIVDGYEYGYGYISRDAFMQGRNMVMNTARNTITLNKKAFDARVRLGLPVFPDMWSSQSLPFSFVNPAINLYTPDYFRAALANALAETDKYVWVYTERIIWWDNMIPGVPKNAPQNYIDALSLAKQGPGTVATPDKIQWPNRVIDLAGGFWKYMRDDANVGEANGWFNTALNEYGWMLTTPDQLSGSMQGHVWYRRKFRCPAVASNKRTFIHITTQDEVASIWLNGQSAGVHDFRNEAPRYYYHVFEITDMLAPGVDNVLALKLQNTEGVYGLNAPIGIVDSCYIYE